MLTNLVLEQQGLSQNSYKTVDINPAGLLAAYAAGQGDGMFQSAVLIDQVNGKRPSSALVLADYGLSVPDYSYIVSPKFLKGHEDVLARFLTASYKAYAAAVADPDAAADQMAKEVPTVPANAANIKAFVAQSAYACMKDSKGKDYGPHDAKQWADAAAQLTKAGIAEGSFDVDKVFTNELFEDHGAEAGVC